MRVLCGIMLFSCLNHSCLLAQPTAVEPFQPKEIKWTSFEIEDFKKVSTDRSVTLEERVDRLTKLYIEARIRRLGPVAGARVRSAVDSMEFSNERESHYNPRANRIVISTEPKNSHFFAKATSIVHELEHAIQATSQAFQFSPRYSTMMAKPTSGSQGYEFDSLTSNLNRNSDTH